MWNTRKRGLPRFFAPALVATAATALTVAVLPTPAEAKLPGGVHCYNDICHRVRTVEETAARRGIVEPLVASFYDAPEKDRFNPSFETSSGTRFQPDADDNAASPIHPDGTVLLLWSPLTHNAVVVRVNNAGPYYPGRTLDVAHGVAERLGFTNGGVMQLLSVVIAAPSEPEAHYVRGRTYPKVHGFIGKFENIALASFAAPVARETLYQGNAPFQGKAAGTSEQFLMNAAQEHFRLSELAREFEAVPAEMIEPPEEFEIASAFTVATLLTLAAASNVRVKADRPAELETGMTARRPVPRKIESAALVLPSDEKKSSRFETLLPVR